MHTPGGLVLAATQIALALKKHPGEVRVIVPHYAMSGGSLIALAADRIILDENAVLGPVDPQISSFIRMYPAASLMSVVQLKNPNRMDDETLIYADVAKKALAQVRKLVCKLLEGTMPSEQALKICQKLTEGYWTHDHPLTVEDLKELNLHVGIGVSSDIFKLINLYPQPSNITPAVEYIPVPYKKQGKPR